MKADTDPA